MEAECCVHSELGGFLSWKPVESAVHVKIERPEPMAKLESSAVDGSFQGRFVRVGHLGTDMALCYHLVLGYPLGRRVLSHNMHVLSSVGVEVKITVVRIPFLVEFGTLDLAPDYVLHHGSGVGKGSMGV